MKVPDPREFLCRCYAAAVASANPAAATQRAVAAMPSQAGERSWIIALGKGAPAMARGASEALKERSAEFGGGIAVSTIAEEVAPPLIAIAGDHPVPAEQSAQAARQLEALVARIPATDRVLVLLSGGTTSLVAAPVEGVSSSDLHSLFMSLLASGADIGTMNAIRKRVLRWGAGRLAAALAPRPVRCLIVSDVVGNDLSSIGSGPCAPDPRTAGELLRLVHEHSLGEALPRGVHAYLERVRSGRAPETPKPGDPAFARVTTEVLLDVRTATSAAADAARALGAAPVIVSEVPLAGDAADSGAALAREAARLGERLSRESLGAPSSACVVSGGETTVRLGPSPTGRGGRCQELALAGARALHELGARGRGVTLLAAGTDGRDGPTDAAGAIVDADTWRRIAERGMDPAAALARHDAYPALDAAGALFRTPPTGTNVNDLALVLIQSSP